MVRKSRLRNMIAPVYRKWIIRILRLVLVLAMLVLAAQVLVLPHAVRYAVARALTSLGQGDAPFTVTSATYFRAEISDVRIRAAGARAVAIAATYSPWSLLRGQLHTIRCTGLEFSLAIEDGQLQRIEALPQFSGDGDQTLDLPFDRMELRSSTLQLLWEGRRLYIPVQGNLNVTGGSLIFDLSAHLQGTPVAITGKYAGPQDYRLKLAAPRLEAAALSAALPPAYVRKFAILGDGNIDLHAEHYRSGGAGGTSVSLQTSGLFLRGNISGLTTEARQVSANLTASLDDTFNPRDLQLILSAGEATVHGQAMRSLRLVVMQEGESLVLDASAAGDDFAVERLRLRWHDALARGPADRAQQVTGQISVSGRPPADLRRASAARGVTLWRVGAAHVSGAFAASWRPPAGAPAQWSVSTDALRVRIDPGDIGIAAAKTTLQGASADLRVSIHADERGIRGALLPGSQVALRGLNALPGTLQLKPADTQSPIFRAEIESDPLEFSITGETWSASAPALRLSVPDHSAQFAGAKIEPASATLLLSAKSTLEDTTIRVRDGSELRAGSITVPLKNDVLRSSATRVMLREPPGISALALNHRTGVVALNLRAEIHGVNDAGPALASKEMRIGSGPIRVSVEAGMGKGEPRLTGVVQLDQGSFHHEPAGVRVEGVSARVPITINAPMIEMGAFSVPKAVAGPTHLPPLEGHLAIMGTRAQLETHWDVLDRGSVEATGHVDFGGDQLTGRIDAELPAFEIRDADAVAQLVPLLQGYQITGTLAGRAWVEFIGDQHKAHVEASVRNGRMENKQSQWLFDGIEISLQKPLVFDSLSPLSTNGGQEIKVARARLGSLKLSDGVARFRIESNQIVQVEAIDFGWINGRLSASTFRLDRANPRIESTITGDRFDMGAFLAMFTDRMTGTGQLYGRLPIEVRWPQTKEGDPDTVKWKQPQLQFGEGFLYATPGTDGRIGIKNPEQFVGPSLDQDPRFRPGGILAGVRHNILNALENLAYSILKVDIVYREIDGERILSAAVLISGKGINGANPQEIGSFRLNINGIDEVLKRVIGYQGGLAIDR